MKHAIARIFRNSGRTRLLPSRGSARLPLNRTVQESSNVVQSRGVITLQQSPVSHPWRRFLRFSVRMLILLVVTTGASLGFLVMSARSQRDAIAAIAAAHDSWIEFDWAPPRPLSRNWFPSAIKPAAKSWLPQWLIDRGAVDYVHHVTSVSLYSYDRPVSDAVLEHVSKLPQLERFEVPGSRLTGDGLIKLRSLSRLRQLNVSDTLIVDADLIHLASLTRLEELDLSKNDLTDAGITHLKNLTSLKSLLLDHNPITGSGLVILKTFPHLEELDLSETSVTDSGLKHLAGSTSLRKLSLGCAAITDAGLAHLKGLSNLAELDLSITRVTDAGLVHLKGLPKLSVLHLYGTDVTFDGEKELKLALPGLKITR
jgi:hypothetical protein